ncbi:MAG: hypothetical protein NTY19_22440 [Planctomycetota bacterium]|nr:hypothetical protein [Planctomycetota bacterium]
MLTITRSLARQLRAVFRRAGIGKSPGGYGHRVHFSAGQDGVRIRGMCYQAAVEYRLAEAAEPAEAFLPLDFLAACEGRSPDPVNLDTSVPGKVTASWTDKRVPMVVEYLPDAPDELPDFPAPPAESTVNEPCLWTALREAADTTESGRIRFALDCLQLRGQQGQIIATDSRQVLVQSGFHFPWTEEVLVPASAVFGCRDLPTDQPVGIGKSDDWVTFTIGPWSIALRLEKDARFPDVTHHISDPQFATARLRLSDADAEFLTQTLPRLPTNDEHNCPVTVDLNGQVVVRARGEGQPRATELVLSNSRLEGDPIVFNTNRRYLDRAARLGFRDVHLFGNNVPALCDDGRRQYGRQYLWALLEPGQPIANHPDNVRIESAVCSVQTNPPCPKKKRSKTTVSDTPTTEATKVVESPKERSRVRRPAKKSGSSSLEQLIALRDTLRAAVNQANELIRVQKRHNRESRLVQSTLASLRQLQKVAS